MRVHTSQPILGTANGSVFRRFVVGRSIRWTFVRIIVLVTVCWIVFKIILIPIRVSGPSMEPNYPLGQVNFINKLSYRSESPQRGDVIAIRYAGNSVMMMKRIIGMPGETVAIQNGRVYINGEQLDEPYLEIKPAPWIREPVALGPDEYFIVGDNRSMDIENHKHGIVDGERIVGKPLL